MLPESISNQNVLFSPLNWGMGHVARSISIIQQLLDQKNQVYIACDEIQKAVYEVYFTELFFIEHQPYPFQFSGKGNWAWDLFNQRKKLVARFALERKEVEKYVLDFQIDVVISDHRYGFFSNKKPSVFITHQLHLPLKWFQFPMQIIHHKLIENFSSVWVLDDEKQTLAGKLSRPTNHSGLHYIGWKSRFELKGKNEISCDEVYLVSGPLPYSQDFLNQCVEMLFQKKGNNVLIYPSGLILPNELPSNLKSIESQHWNEIDAYIRGAKIIISRSGYSTIMDLKILNKKVRFYPTPGQMEQIYLSHFHVSKNKKLKFDQISEIECIF